MWEREAGQPGVWPEARSRVWVRKLVSRSGEWKRDRSQAGLREKWAPECLAWGPPGPVSPFSERPLPPAF